MKTNQEKKHLDNRYKWKKEMYRIKTFMRIDIEKLGIYIEEI